nr:iron ABC transporter permease [Rhizobium sp. ACO-34A]
MIWAGSLFVLLGLLFLMPVIMLVIGIFTTEPLGQGADWSFSAFSVLATPNVQSAFIASTVIAIVTSIAGVTIAAVFAFLSERTDAPLRRLITPAMLVMFATPSIYYALGFSLLANPYTGLLNDVARILWGSTGPVVNIESWGGLLTVLTFRTVAFVYLLMVAAFRAIDRAHEDASLASGATPLTTFLRIDLPIIAPALSGAAIYAMIAGLQSFDTPLILGQPVGIVPLASLVYGLIDRQFPPQYSHAGLLGTILVVIALAMATLQHRLLGRKSFVSIGGKGARPEPHRLGRWGAAAGSFIALYLLIVQIIPFGMLIFSAFQPYPGVYGTLTLQHFSRVLASPRTTTAVTTTIALSVGVSFVSMVLALAIAVVSNRLSAVWGALMRSLVLIPFAMPGIVTAVAIVWAYISIPGLRELYGTVWLMAIGLVVVVMPFALHQAQSGLSQIAPELYASAQVSGAPPARAFADIVLPLILPHFLTGWFLAAIAIAGTLDIPLLLGSPHVTTIAAEVFDLSAQGKVAQAAALLIMLVGGLSLAGLLCLAVRRWARNSVMRRVMARANATHNRLNPFSASVQGATR